MRYRKAFLAGQEKDVGNRINVANIMGDQLDGQSSKCIVGRYAGGDISAQGSEQQVDLLGSLVRPGRAFAEQLRHRLGGDVERENEVNTLRRRWLWGGNRHVGTFSEKLDNHKVA